MTSNRPVSGCSLIPRAPASSARGARHARPRLDPAERDRHAGRLRRLRVGVVLLAVGIEIPSGGRKHDVFASAYETPAAEVLQSGTTPAVAALVPGSYRIVYSPSGQAVRSVTIPVAAVDQCGSGLDRVGHQ
jgi:hypothetical protein